MNFQISMNALVTAIIPVITSNRGIKGVILGVLLVYGLESLQQWRHVTTDPAKLKELLLSFVIQLLRRIPFVARKIDSEKVKAKEAIASSFRCTTDLGHFLSIPKTGLNIKETLGELESRAKIDRARWSNGNLTGTVYTTSAELDEIHGYALSKFGKANLLHPDVFTCTRQMEAEVVRMTLSLFTHQDDKGINPDYCGSVTTGGTESILLAVKAYRDFCSSELGIMTPNIVIPSSAHAAFVKAGQYFKIQVRKAYCDPNRFYEVDLAHMESLIDSNTIMLVGSAPQYPHGTMDPIPAIAQLAMKHQVGCHVDACLGSFNLYFLKDQLPYCFDFSVPGVTSISCDTHKYAYAPKGSSVLMFRSKRLRQYQYSICTDWEGGLYATPTITGSRCSSTTAAAWATMIYMGYEGYRECAIKLREGARLIERCVRDELSNELVMMGRTDTSVVSFTTKRLNIFDIAEYMKSHTKRQWSLAILQRPAGVHFAVTMANVDNCAEFTEDLRCAVQSECNRVANGGKIGSSDSAAIYGSTSSVPSVLVNELVVDYLDACYEPQGQ